MRYPAGGTFRWHRGLAYVGFMGFNMVAPVCVLIWFMTAPEPLATTLTLIGLLVILCLQPPLAQVALGSWDPFHVLNILGFAYLAYFPVKALLLIFYFQDVGSYHQLNAALAYSIVGLLALYAGYASRVGELLGGLVPKFPGDWGAGRPQKAALLYLVVSAFSAVVLIQSVGGFRYYVTHLELRGFFLEGKGYVLWGMQLVGVAVPLYFCSLLTARRRHLSGAFYAYLAAALCLEMLTGGRSNTIAMIITMLMAGHYLRRTFNWRRFWLVGMGAVVFFVVAAQYRLSFGQPPPEPVGFRVDVERSLRDDLSALDPFLRILRALPREIPFQNGRTLFDLVIYPVPRTFWRGKPEVLGANGLYSATFEPAAFRAGAVSGASVLGELYMNFGSLGIVFGMFFYGVLCRALYSQVDVRLPSKSGILLYVTGLYPVILGIRGGFWALVPALLTAVITAWVTLAYVSRRASAPSGVHFVAHQLPAHIKGGAGAN